MIDRTIFVTGAQRSGTTLLEKLLGAQESIAILSQPFPLLFTEVKRTFLGGTERYPLGHLFHESRYEHDAFAEFLRGWRTTPAELEAIFTRMETYSGQYTRFTAEQRRGAFSRISARDDFASVVSSLDRWLAPKDSEWFGSKETTCEEYVPPLLERGIRCVIILRDPRDVIASLNYGRGSEFGGEVKPTLFNLRHWRKSVAVALAMEGHPRFHFCRYEDLVAEPARELERLARALELPELAVPSEFRDESGNIWRGNSSHTEHRGVGTSSVATYRDILPRNLAEFIEAACLPELQRLGYHTTLTRNDATRIIEAFEEPYPSTRAGMEADAITAENKSLEAQRLALLTESSPAAVTRWFLFPEAHAKLREAFRP